MRRRNCSNWLCFFFCNWDKNKGLLAPLCGSVPLSSSSTSTGRKFPSNRPGMFVCQPCVLFGTQGKAAHPGLLCTRCACDGCTLCLYSYIYIFIISVIVILHIHLAVIHTFSICVSSPDSVKLQFEHQHPQIRRGGPVCSVLQNSTVVQTGPKKNRN